MSAVLLNLDGMRIIVMFRIVLRWMKNAVVVKLGSRFIFGILMVSLPHLLMIIGALERFNRELNHAFPNAHPSMSGKSSEEFSWGGDPSGVVAAGGGQSGGGRR